ncbi:hypothetical protein D9758_005834 [Tetrapyrgos nigripes]|uniref:Uncharacterized protein n=1 Tax=Tetrapyrgos nigripes TaxID=182062 RepID=A0A8H5G2R5_9AGAR|nr:hypothetical protein D9758_005834 [Tetrapyrgos nigripes]
MYSLAFLFLLCARFVSSESVPNRFIIEVDSESAINLPSKRDSASLHERVYEHIRARDIGFSLDREFNEESLFVGAALTLEDPRDVATLRDSPGVKSIRAVQMISRPRFVDVYTVSGEIGLQNTSDQESTHVMTGVDKLHAQGITGKGIKIGIIDTGVDYRHPALGGGFGPGYKIVGGYDFVGDAYEGGNPFYGPSGIPMPDSDPLDTCSGHGTHVAGILAADPSNEYNISGVAYSATISAYRVFGCRGNTPDDIVIEALLRAFRDGQDIITLSLGDSGGWAESVTSAVANRLAHQGKIITIAAGNSGATGGFYASSPSSGIDTIAVASVDNTVLILRSLRVQGVQHDPIPYYSSDPLPVPEPLPIYATSNDTNATADACEPLPDTTPDLSKYVVIVRRGTCLFVTKLKNIADKGGKFMLIYNNKPDFGSIDVGKYNASFIRAADGEYLVSQFVASVPIKLDFPQEGDLVEIPSETGGLVSSFSSYGPNYDMYLKPAIAAPGAQILSTLPNNTYGGASGTSMATPFMAGAAALFLSTKQLSGDVPITVRTVLQTTAQPILSNNTGSDLLQTAAQQGAGLVNVFNAIHYETLLSPGEFLLNDSAHFNGQHKLTVQNTGNSEKTYTIRHKAAATALMARTGTIFTSLGPVNLTRAAADVSFSTSSFTLAPGTSQSVDVTFTLPSDDESTLPVYSGFIHVATDSEDLHVTYQGLGASLANVRTLDDTDYFFGHQVPLLLDASNNVQTDATNYTFNNVTGDYPVLISRLSFGTPLFRVDLVDPDFHPEGNNGTLPIVQRLDWAPRSSEDNDDGNAFNYSPLNSLVFHDGTDIPKGTYRFLVRSLRVNGDAANLNHYDSWLSPIVGIFP